MIRTIDIPDLAATEAFGRRLGELLFPGAVVALVGQLGAGKTHLTRAVAEGLGVKNPAAVNSPTFVLIQEYPARLPIYHFDAYRLTGPREFAELGVDEYFRGAGVCIVEWADKVETTLPAEHLRIDLAIVDENRRRFKLTPSGPKHSALMRSICGIVPDEQLAPAILALLKTNVGFGCDQWMTLRVWPLLDGTYCAEVCGNEFNRLPKLQVEVSTPEEAVAEFLRLRHETELGFDYMNTVLPGGFEVYSEPISTDSPDTPTGPP